MAVSARDLYASTVLRRCAVVEGIVEKTAAVSRLRKHGDERRGRRETRGDTKAGAVVLRGSSLAHRFEVLELIHVTLKISVQNTLERLEGDLGRLPQVWFTFRIEVDSGLTLSSL